MVKKNFFPKRDELTVLKIRPEDDSLAIGCFDTVHQDILSKIRVQKGAHQTSFAQT